MQRLPGERLVVPAPHSDRAQEVLCADCLLLKSGYDRCMQDRQDLLARCIQIFGGTTASSRRLGIDERAVRRFINGERPISDSLLQDIATAMRDMAADANAAAADIADIVNGQTTDT